MYNLFNILTSLSKMDSRRVACTLVFYHFCTELNFTNGENVVYTVLRNLVLTPWESSKAGTRFRRSENFTSLISFDPGNRAFVVNDTLTATIGNTPEATSTSSTTTTTSAATSLSTSVSTTTSLSNITSLTKKTFSLKPKFGKKPVKLILLKRKLLKDDPDKNRIKPKKTGILESKINNVIRSKVVSKLTS